MTISGAPLDAARAACPPSAPRRETVATLAVWLVGAAFAVATVVVLYPGQYTFDAAYQIWQARTGEFSNQSPVVMTALWSALIRASGNPAALFCVNVALFWTGLVLCALSIAGHALGRIVLLVACGLGPLAMVQMAHVLTDAHLAAVLVLAAGLAARYAATQRTGAIVAFVAVILYAASVRHNAALATIPFPMLAAIAARPRARRPAAVAVAGAALLTVASVAIGLSADRALVVRHVNLWPVIALWDLAAISVDRGVLLLPPFTHGPGMSVDELTQTGAFDVRENTLLFSKTRSGIRDGVEEPYSSARLRELFYAWIEAALRHPVAYAHHRLRTFWLLIGSHTGASAPLAYFVDRATYRDDPPLPQPIAPRLQSSFYDLAAALRPSWAFAALPYLAANALACVLALRRRRRRPLAPLGLAVGASALLYALGYLPLAPAADLRYLTWPIVAAPLALAFALSPRRSKLQGGTPAITR